MLARRTLLGTAAAAPLIWNKAFAETARDAAVMAMQIDDLTSLDPGESFEASGDIAQRSRSAKPERACSRAVGSATTTRRFTAALMGGFPPGLWT